MNSCPHCGSSDIASRRSLFHALVSDSDTGVDFHWYDLSAEEACPPKSLFMGLLALLLMCSWIVSVCIYLNFFSVVG